MTVSRILMRSRHVSMRQTRLRAMLSLLVLSGPAAGAHLRVPKEGATIGGDPKNAEICIPDPGIAPRHARITRQGPGRYTLKDLESPFGVYLEGNKVSERALEDGDRLRISAETV